MPNLKSPVDGERVQELVSAFIEGRKAARKLDVLAWGMMSPQKMKDMIDEIAELNRKVELMNRSEAEFASHAYRIVDNVITTNYYCFENARVYMETREDLRQSLILELYELRKRYDPGRNDSFARYAFATLKLQMTSLLFGSSNGSFDSANEKKLHTVAGSKVVSFEKLQEDNPALLEKTYQYDFESAIMKKDVNRVIRETIEGMTNENEKKMIEMVFFRGMSVKEAAVTMNLTDCDYRNIYRHALKVIERSLIKNERFRNLYDDERKGVSS